MKFIFSLLISIIFNPCFSQSTDQEFEAMLLEYDMIGMSALVVCGEEVVFEGNYGLSNYSLNIPVTPLTKYRIASISKTVTAMAFMKLVENNLVNLDDDISEILGYQVINPSFSLVAITPRMLLSHTSSIQDGNGYNSFLSDTYSDDIPAISELITTDGNYYTSNIFSINQPGTYFAYSNLNYGIIGTLIEKISQQRFDLFVRENILQPLEIDGSFNIQDLSSLENLATIYRKIDGSWVEQADDFEGVFPEPLNLENYAVGENGLIFSPQGGLRLSSIDLSKIMRVLSNYGTFNDIEILDSTTVSDMRTTEWLFDGTNGDNYGGLFQSWGLGLHKLTNAIDDDVIYENENMIGHAGEAYGLVSDMYFQKEGSFGIIFVTNGIGQDYEYGLYSDFYTVEESAFKILFDNEITNCLLNTSTNEDKKNSIDVSIFPNPSSTYLNIKVLKSNSSNLRIDIFDNLGKLIFTDLKINMDGNLKINTTKLTAGVYRINFYDGYQNYSKKFRVE